MQYTIKSYLKIGSEFREICSINPSEIDPEKNRHIEGAIEWSIENISIINKKHWDLVDQLWCYIIEGLESAIRGEDFKICFPDQPLKLEFYPTGRNFVNVVIGDDTYPVSRGVFFQSLIKGSEDFFLFFSELYPVWENFSNIQLGRINALK